MTIWISWEPPLFNFECLDISWAHTYTRVKSYGRLNLPRAIVLSFKRLDVLRAWIGDLSEMLWQFKLLESFRCSFSSVSIYNGPHTYTRVKSYGCWNLPRASMFNFESLDILCAPNGHPSKMLWKFEFLVSFSCSFSSISIYHGRHIYKRVKSYGRLNLPRASCWVSSVSIYYAPESEIQVKCYDHLNFSRAFVYHFQAYRYVMGLTLTPESKVIAVWIFWELSCTISRVSIYYESEPEIRVKCYDHLNFSRASMVHCRTSQNIVGLTYTPE